MQVGRSTGQHVMDYCDVRAQAARARSGICAGAVSRPGSEVWAYSPVNPYAMSRPASMTRATGAGTYTIPKVDVLVSATMTSSPGIPLEANWTIPAPWRAKSLGRDLVRRRTSQRDGEPARSPTTSEAIASTSSTSAIAKILRFGSSRANVALDLYNALNADTILIPNQAFIPNGAWLTPTGTQTPVMTARTAKFTVQYRLLDRRGRTGRTGGRGWKAGQQDASLPPLLPIPPFLPSGARRSQWQPNFYQPVRR